MLKYDFLELQSDFIGLNMSKLLASTIHFNPDFPQEEAFLPV